MLTLAAVLMFVGMSVDSFAVSLGKGLAIKQMTPAKAVRVGIWFGAFHAAMPLVGYAVGVSISEFIAKYDNWVLFIVFMVLGGMLIKDAIFEGDEDHRGMSDSISFKVMMPLAFIVSLDAMMAGVTFSVGSLTLWEGSLFLGLANFAAGFLGMYVGSKFGDKFGRAAVFVGGLILVVNAFLVVFEAID